MTNDYLFIIKISYTCPQHVSLIPNGPYFQGEVGVLADDEMKGWI